MTADSGIGAMMTRVVPHELRNRYRMGARYAYVAPLITAGLGGMQAEGVRRGVAVLEDLETVALREKSLR